MRLEPLVGVTVMLVLYSNGCIGQEATSASGRDYFGQQPPGLIPELFAPGIVSTQVSELNLAMSPDGNQIFFTEWIEGNSTLMVIERADGKWLDRTVASFSGVYADVDPFITQDGKRLYFSSKRALDGHGPEKDSDIWYVELDQDGSWGDPIHLEGLNSPDKDDYYTSLTSTGDLYFSQFEGQGGGGDIYYWSQPVGGEYGSSEPVAEVNTQYSEHDPFVARDGSYLIFSSSRPGGRGRGDLYVSFRAADGTWSEPGNMGDEINTEGYEFCPMLSPDGRYLFFTRNVEDNGDIYWVDARIIAGMGSAGLK